jgi:hypothetical protein
MFWLLPWVLTAEIGLFVTLIFLIQLEKFGYSATLVIVSIILYSILSHFFKWPKVGEVFSRENFWLVLRYFGYYMAGTVIWSYGKWVFYLWDFRSARDKKVAEYKESLGVSPENYPNGLTVDSLTRMLGSERYKRGYLSKTPQAKEYKAMIVAWGLWWPASLVGTLLDSPIRRLVNFIFDRFSGLYQWTANKMVPEIKL